PETLDRANHHAVGVLAVPARLAHDVSHGRSGPFCSRAYPRHDSLNAPLNSSLSEPRRFDVGIAGARISVQPCCTLRAAFSPFAQVALTRSGLPPTFPTHDDARIGSEMVASCRTLPPRRATTPWPWHPRPTLPRRPVLLVRRGFCPR